MDPKPGNPWRLTPGQERVIDSLARHGVRKLVASELGIEVSTVCTQLERVKLKMRKRFLIQCAVEYDRWKRGQA